MRRVFILNIMLAALSIGCFTACSDDDEVVINVEDADPAQVREADATYNSLTFAWNKVEGVNQYGYTLYDADGVTVEDGVTQSTSVTFTDLHTDAHYNFELRVYHAYGSPSYRACTSASTLPIRQLDAPKATVNQQGNKIVLSWEAVPGAAAYQYTYTIGDNVISCVITATECTIIGLAPGEHTASLMALSDYGGYTDSDEAIVKIQRTRKETATVEGTYTCGLMRRNNSWPCTMHAYDDGSYVIDAFYQGEGYNLDFYVDTDAETGASYIGIYNFVSFPACEYYVLDTGRASVPQIDAIPGLVDGEYGSSFASDAASGTMTMNVRYGTTTGTDKFVWNW